MGKWFRSLCPATVTCLRWTMVGWIVGSFQFSVSVLIVFAILTDPPISVVGNNIWASCSLPVIWLLVILSPIGVVICLDSSIILSMQARKYFTATAFTVMLTFAHFFARVNCFARNWFNFIARAWFNYFARICTLICLILLKRNMTIFLRILLSTIYFCRVVLSISTSMFAALLKCAVLCYEYASRLSDSLWQLPIQVLQVLVRCT